MPGAACLEVYVRAHELYAAGEKAPARDLFHRLVPYLSFAMQHLEVAIHIEKRVLVRRGILPNARMRHPTLTLDQTYQNQMDGLVTSVVALAEECRRMKPAAV
jgi:dihydrodipicolinate synthase/N-acetylneuraminate lyase